MYKDSLKQQHGTLISNLSNSEQVGGATADYRQHACVLDLQQY